MTEPITEADALQRFPELEALVTMREAGWVFRLIYDDDGQPGCLVGSYTRRQYTDAIVIHDQHNVSAARILDDHYGGGCVWKTENNGLQETVYELLALPEPDTRGAPNLVKAASMIWTP
jgi:hypothetical protein